MLVELHHLLEWHAVEVSKEVRRVQWLLTSGLPANVFHKCLWVDLFLNVDRHNGDLE